MERSSTAQARTPLHYWHAARGAHFVDTNGWQIPVSYAEIDQEIAAARAGVGLVDLSAFAKISLRGQGVTALTLALVGDSPALKPQGVSTFDAKGPVLACRLTKDHLLLLTSMTDATALRERLTALRQEEPVLETDVTSAYARFCLLGPGSENVLPHLTALDVAPAAFPAASCAETSLAGVHAIFIRPPGSTFDGMHICVAWDLGEYIWERLLDAGRCYRMVSVGLDAWPTMRGGLAWILR